MSPAGNRVRRAAYVRHADPMFISSLMELGPEERRKTLFEVKVAEKLRKASGKVEVEIWLDRLTPEVIEKLTKLGLTVDAKDQTLKVLFGTCDVKVLKDLVEDEHVERIEPIT